MAEIMARGPITCGVAAPDDFVFKYHSGRQGGVYVDNSGAPGTGAARGVGREGAGAVAVGGRALVWRASGIIEQVVNCARASNDPCNQHPPAHTHTPARIHTSHQHPSPPQKKGDSEIDHDVEVVGWGVDKASGLKFWEVRRGGLWFGCRNLAAVVAAVGGGGACRVLQHRPSSYFSRARSQPCPQAHS